jgi:AmmeMemoRadiSam system protein B
MSAQSRPAVLAGQWYPGTAEGCDQFFASVAPLAGPSHPRDVVAAIAPHAGWVYSGAVAFHALEALARARADARLVIVFGGHLGLRDRPRVMVEGAWQTPYGEAPIARGVAGDLSMAVETESPDELDDDNAIEVLMPIVKRLWPTAEVLTIGVPPTDAAMGIGVEAVELARRRGIERVAIVGSTDLTHYGPNYDYQPQGRGRAGHTWVKTKNDPELLAHVEALDAPKVLWTAQRTRAACCPGAIAATIGAAKKLGASVGHTLEHVTSYEARPTAAEPTSFVGYAGVVLGR